MYTKLFIFISLLLVTTSAYATPPYVVQNQVLVPQRVIQYDGTYFSGVQGLYKVGEQIKAEKEAVAQAVSDDKLKQLSDQIERLAKAIEGKIENGTTVKPAELVPEAPPKDSLDTKIATLFKGKCLACHSGGTNKFQIFDASGKLDVDIKKAVKIHYRVEGLVLNKGESVMPLNGKPLTNPEMLDVKKWLSGFTK